MKITIGYAGDVSNPSGGTDRITALTSGLSQFGHDVVLIIPEPINDIPERLNQVTVQTVNPSLNNGVHRAVSVARRSLTEADEETFLQLEHTILGAVGKFLGGYPIVLDMHDLAYSRFDHVETRFGPVLKRAISYIERYATKRAFHIIVVSDYMKEFIIDKWSISPDSVSVIPNGYFPDVIEPVRNTEIVDGRVCFLGTLHPKVDIETICDIADIQSIDEMVVIGDGAQFEKLQSLATSHQKLTVTGRLPNIEAFELVASSELLVNPQQPSELQRSSSPVKLYYYSALGKPIVTTQGPSVVDYLVRNDACIAPTTGKEFVESVKELLNHPAKAEQLGHNAKELSREFRWSERISRFNSLYETLEL